jgi:hypothetical protein
MAWFLNLLLGVGLNIVAYLIMPKPKPPKPESVKDLDDPTAGTGRPLPVVFGSMRVQGLNILWYGEKSTIMRQMRKKSSKK